MVKARQVETPLTGATFRLYTWILEADETGEPVLVAGFRQKTIFVGGEFGGGAVAVEIAPDPAGSLYLTASDRHGTALSGIRSARVEVIAEHGYLVRPVAGPRVERVGVWLVLST